MSSNNGSSASGGGASISTVLVVVFLVLKLVGTIHWSWIWVFSPWWISAGLFLVFLGSLGLVAVGAALTEARSDRKWRQEFDRKYPNAR